MAARAIRSLLRYALDGTASRFEHSAGWIPWKTSTRPDDEKVADKYGIEVGSCKIKTNLNRVNHYNRGL